MDASCEGWMWKRVRLQQSSSVLHRVRLGLRATRPPLLINPNSFQVPRVEAGVRSGRDPKSSLVWRGDDGRGEAMEELSVGHQREWILETHRTGPTMNMPFNVQRPRVENRSMAMGLTRE